MSALSQESVVVAGSIGEVDVDAAAVVKRSFARLEPDTDAFAAAFFERLFELDLALWPLFRGDIDEMGRKLMSMLALAVNGLDDFETVAPALVALGQRHVLYGVGDGDYATMETALMETLDRWLGDGFDERTRLAWVEAYRLFAATMRGRGGLSHRS